MYPVAQPSHHGMLAVGDGQRLYWQVCGNPEGKPAVVLHGGPGSGATPGWTRYFDPERYRIVLLDQRGAGRSTPSVRDPSTDLSVNTTAHLVADLEALRAHLGIERWLVLGGSWGATFGLSYAVRHPGRVTELVLFAVTTTRRRDVDYLTRGVGRYFPEAYVRFRAGVPEDQRSGDLAAAYARLLASPEAEVRAQAAADWCAWEYAIVALEEDPAPDPQYADPAFRYGFSRLVTHYFSNAAFQDDDAIVGRLERLHGIPGILVHGRLDLAGPADTAWDIARGWPDARLVIVGGVGHAGSAAMSDVVVAATDRFAASRQGAE
jgi:proline iminopeptidase